MPNDPTTGSFPLPADATPQALQAGLPAQTANAVGGNANPQFSPEVKLTDEVAPDLSAPILAPAPAPVTPEPVYQPPAAPIPATLPTPARRPFPIVTILLILISIGAIAAAYFFYQQTKALNVQITQISQTLDQRQIQENQATPTPTPDLSITETPNATPSPTITTGTGMVFGEIQSVITTAQKQYPNAQLIMIKTESAKDQAPTTIKYWFRQTQTDKKYLYTMKETGKDLVVVDQQVTVAENALTPSLNQLAAEGKLGLDLPEAIGVAQATCPTTFDCLNAPITGQYIKSSTTLWQISFKSADNTQPFVVQIDAASKKILYKSI